MAFKLETWELPEFGQAVHCYFQSTKIECVEELKWDCRAKL